MRLSYCKNEKCALFETRCRSKRIFRSAVLVITKLACYPSVFWVTVNIVYNRIVLMLLLLMMLMMDAASCYVKLHGWGKNGEIEQMDWYKLVALNGVEYMNNYAGGPGIITYKVDSSCNAYDNQHFNTHGDATASDSLINYLNALTNGRLTLTFFLF